MINNQQRAFRDRMTALAKEISPKYGVDWRLMVAAAILESGWGESELARRALNLFGIKATNGFKDDEVYLLHGERFRKFQTERDAFRSYGWHMSQSKHYAPARAQAKQAALRVFIAHMALVYCPPDKEYGMKLLSLIHSLDDFDTQKREEKQ